MAADRGREHPAAVLRGRTRTAGSPSSRWSRTRAASHPVLRSHRIAIGLYDRTEAGLIRRHRVETDVAGARTVMAELAGEPQPGPGPGQRRGPDLRQDPARRALAGTLIGSIGTFTDSLPAALCWSAAWDMTRDGEMAARDYVRLVLSGISSVADISVVQTLLRQASQAVRRFADPGLAGDRAGPDRRHAARPAPDGSGGLGHASSPTSAPSPAWPPPTTTWPCWPACSTAR